MQDLRISFMQTSLHWEDKQANLGHFDALIDSLSTQTDLIVLPEMFTTGFSMNASALAEDMQGESVCWMIEKAKSIDAVILGSLIIRDHDQYYNRMVVTGPQGLIGHYDKRHTFSMASEDQTFTQGSDRMIFEWRGWKISPFVCYDLRFPVWSRNRYTASTGWGYDLAIYVANWPAPRAHAWKSLAIARAIENQCFVAALNRVGLDGNGLVYQGDSRLLNSYGETVLDLGTDESVQTILIDHIALQKHRNIFPVGQDADKFILG